MSRYYGHQYDRLDDPDWNPNLEANESAVNLGSFEPYRAQDDNAPLNRDTTYQPALPSNYLDSKYPPRGISGLKSRSWDKWSRRTKIIVVGSVVAVLIIIIAIIVGVEVGEHESGVDYEQSFAKVTNTEAFTAGGAAQIPQGNHVGIGAGEDKYTYYQGDASNFPSPSQWVTFQKMWSNNLATIQGSCMTLGDGANDTPEEIQFIAEAIKNRSTVSLVDHRFILAIILQESQGCVRAGSTTSSGGVHNPGLMQSHNGHSFNPSNPQLSILQMVQDGTQGTTDGAGLVQNLNKYGNAYAAARGYNSGYIPKSGDLSEAAGATGCYVSDVANRLTGWTTAPNECPGEKGQK